MPLTFQLAALITITAVSTASRAGRDWPMKSGAPGVVDQMNEGAGMLEVHHRCVERVLHLCAPADRSRSPCRRARGCRGADRPGTRQQCSARLVFRSPAVPTSARVRMSAVLVGSRVDWG